MFRKLCALVCFSGMAFPLFSALPAPQSEENDLMYPPAPAAKAAVDFDGAGFTLDGQRTFYTSGSIHYSRVPHELWYDRLLRLKRANFAAVQTYTFWNFHEPQEGRFDFTGDKDFERFLDTAQMLGLYATVRVGPYVCAEWDSGGYPVWLKFKPSFMVRTNDAAYLHWNDHWYEKILPMVARHQVNHGGNVALVQLENEHPRGWGVLTNNSYFTHLSDDAVKWGIEVPYFMSGQHHGATPMPGNLNSHLRSNPWFTTEFWAGWYNVYGALSDQRNREIEKTTWTILAHGGGGYNYYMLHGGTDFDTWNNDEVGASYDDGAAIGQAGDLRPVYYRMKRINQLAESFPEILADGNDALADNQDFATGTGIKILGARKSNRGAGTLIFVQNVTANLTLTLLKSGAQLMLEPHTIYPFPQDVALANGWRIAAASLPILGVTRNGQTESVIMYGPSDANGQLVLAASQDLSAATGHGDDQYFSMSRSDQNHLVLNLKIPANGVAEYFIPQSSGHSLRILAISNQLSLYTWILGKPGRQYAVFGPEYVQDVTVTNGAALVVLERPYGQAACGQVAVFGAGDQSWHLAVKADTSLDDQAAPQLQNWQMSAMTENDPRFDDSRWLHSRDPLPMGADGDISAFAWYRARLNLSSPMDATLRLRADDNVVAFVDGQFVSDVKTNITAHFLAGTNSIAIFVSHHGRNKAFGYLGSLAYFDRKGIWGRAILEFNGGRKAINDWTIHGGVTDDLAAGHWSTVHHVGHVPAFYRSTFVANPPSALGAHPILRVNYCGLTRGTMWINGHNLGRYPEKISIDSLYIPECWLTAGVNTLTIFDEEGASPEQVSLVVEHAASREVIRANQTVDPHTPMTIP